MIKIEFKELRDDYAEFTVEGVRPYFVNALRRVLISEVPKLAIDGITIYDNTTALFDEIIAHRIGLVPIPTYLEQFKFRNECVCNGDGCPNCTVRYTLSKEGPGTVYSGDLTPESPSFVVADPEIPIVELEKGQRLILEAEAVLGTGKQHAKWQPVVACGYGYYPSILIDGKEADDKTLQKTFPKECFLDKRKSAVENAEKYISTNNVTETQDDRPVSIKRHDDKFAFRFETDGSMKASDVVKHACDIVFARYEEFNKAAKKLLK